MIVDGSQGEASVFESIWGHLQELDQFREIMAPVEYTQSVPNDPLQTSLFPVTDRDSS